MDLSCIISSGDLELYVLGKLSAKETEQVEALAQIFPEVKEEIQRIEQTLEALALEAAVTPSAGVKEKLLQNLPSQQIAPVVPLQQKKGRTTGNTAVLLRIAAVSLLILLVGGSIYFNNRVNSLQNTTAQLQEQVDSKNELLQQWNEAGRFLQKPGVKSIALASVKNEASVFAKIYWNTADTEVYIDAAGLPQAPKGYQYQLWCIRNGTPADAGMIPLNGAIAMHKMKSCAQSEAFAITLEKEGGSPTPTLEQMIVMGKVAG